MADGIHFDLAGYAVTDLGVCVWPWPLPPKFCTIFNNVSLEDVGGFRPCITAPPQWIYWICHWCYHQLYIWQQQVTDTFSIHHLISAVILEDTVYDDKYFTRFLLKYTTVYKKKKEMFYLTTHSTHFIYGYMASVIQENNRCKHCLYTYTYIHIYIYIYIYIYLRTYLPTYLYIYIYIYIWLCTDIIYIMNNGTHSMYF